MLIKTRKYEIVLVIRNIQVDADICIMTTQLDIPEECNVAPIIQMLAEKICKELIRSRPIDATGQSGSKEILRPFVISINPVSTSS
ncbi:MAG TPA: hypothetical protein PK367_00375 [Candidatus Paceibacterota bacterium]|nr:hypothetical protein [Candidatus Paceibacterota bacterium]